VAPVDVVVLAAGCGRRIAPYIDQLPKCLVEVDGATLLRRHLMLCRRLGAARIHVVVGHRAALVEAEVARTLPDGSAGCVRNDDFAHGSILSLRRGLAEVEGHVIYTDADVFYHPDVLARLFAAEAASCLLVDGAAELDDEAMVVGARGDRAGWIGRRRQAGPGWDALGESIGFVRIGAATLPRFRAALDETIAAGGPDQEWESGLAALLPRADVRVVRVDGLPWTEVDDAADLRRARDEVAPLAQLVDG
jgi:choline kinase